MISTMELLSYREAAELLGLNASTLRKYRQQGRMPAPDRVVCPVRGIVEDNHTCDLDRPFWLADTLTAWQASRPGRGRWGRS